MTSFKVIAQNVKTSARIAKIVHADSVDAVKAMVARWIERNGLLVAEIVAVGA